MIRFEIFLFLPFPLDHLFSPVRYHQEMATRLKFCDGRVAKQRKRTEEVDFFLAAALRSTVRMQPSVQLNPLATAVDTWILSSTRKREF
ncbi:hypothetical protein NPIL_624411 [Nephila pilipes]|uniref:Uncharacterized protein n=1 Tax=Nephila pilipes TaxID=299642 RepID=A0A8X6N985_NEPPI|nr:hypothetical protein NPIL_624411 [Nephila pilipes]